MKRCEVIVAFRMFATKTDHVAGDIIVVSDEQLAMIQSVNINMVQVLGDVADEDIPEAKKKPRKPKTDK